MSTARRTSRQPRRATSATLGITSEQVHKLLDAGLSISATARALRCSQPNISQRLRRERNARGLRRVYVDIDADGNIVNGCAELVSTPIGRDTATSGTNRGNVAN